MQPDELMMLSLPDNISIIQRTHLLLQKTGKQQKMAVLSPKNLLWLVNENVLLFSRQVVPLLNEQIKLLKDEDIIMALC